MTDGSLPDTLAWLRSAQGRPTPAEWVPGAVPRERQSLGALAAVAGHALGGPPPAGWHPKMVQWLATAPPTELPLKVQEELDKGLALAPDATLAHLYAGLVAGSHRRVLGTFFTPAVEVGPMLDMWDAIEQPPTSIVDVGAGVGVFSAAAGHQWPAARIDAVDVNPVTLALLGCRMAQPDVSHVASRVNLILEDFTQWLPSTPRSPGDRRLILGNPPYTRWQLIDTDDRLRLSAQTANLCGRRASLSAYITALSLLSLQPSDGVCLLLPAQWLESDYARGLRLRLLSLARRHVELRLVKSSWFADATVDAVVLLVGSERATHQPFLIAEWGEARAREIDRLASSADGWRAWFNDASIPPRAEYEGPRLGDVARIRRGIATGANDFFLLSDEMLNEHRIPKSLVMPVIRRLADYSHGATSASFTQQSSRERKWLLMVTSETMHVDVAARYVRHGEGRKLNHRHLCRRRKPTWFDLTQDLFIPDMIISSMTRNSIHVVKNTIGAAITNNLYGWVWDARMDAQSQIEVLEWLKSSDGQHALLSTSRQQGNGLAKLEPKALANLRLPAALLPNCP